MIAGLERMNRQYISKQIGSSQVVFSAIKTVKKCLVKMPGSSPRGSRVIQRRTACRERYIDLERDNERVCS